VALAVIAFEDGQSRTYRVGDIIGGLGRVIAVEPGRVRLETSEGERVALLEAGEGQALPASGPAAPTAQDTSSETIVPVAPGTPSQPIAPVAQDASIESATKPAAAGPELKEGEQVVNAESSAKPMAMSAEMAAEISNFAARADISGMDLDLYLLRYLDLPGTATIEGINNRPLTHDRADIEELRQALDLEIPIRLTIGGVDGLNAIYLTPEALMDTGTVTRE